MSVWPGSYVTTRASFSNSTVLPFGAFYGRVDRRRASPGLELATLRADPGRVVERHSHEEAHFVFVLEGLYVSSAEGADAISHGPVLVYNPAGTTHRDRFEAQAGRISGRFLTLSISSEMMAAEARGNPLEIATRLREPHLLAVAQRIAKECDVWTGVSPLMSESLALALVTAVNRPHALRAGLPPRWLRVAEEMLRDRCDETVRIAEIAQAAGVHPLHLARVFQRYRGCTPGDYLRRRRVERAEVLLRETARPLTDIALHCGFADQSHFARMFKQQTGRTPGAVPRKRD